MVAAVVCGLLCRKLIMRDGDCGGSCSRARLVGNLILFQLAAVPGCVNATGARVPVSVSRAPTNLIRDHVSFDVRSHWQGRRKQCPWLPSNVHVGVGLPPGSGTR